MKCSKTIPWSNWKHRLETVSPTNSKWPKGQSWKHVAPGGLKAWLCGGVVFVQVKFLHWNVTQASPVEEINKWDATSSLHIRNHSRGRLHLTRLVTNTKTYLKETHVLIQSWRIMKRSIILTLPAVHGPPPHWPSLELWKRPLLQLQRFLQGSILFHRVWQYPGYFWWVANLNQLLIISCHVSLPWNCSDRFPKTHGIQALFVGDIWWGGNETRLKAEGKCRLDKICQMHKHGIVSSEKSILLSHNTTVDGSEIRLTSWYGKYPIMFMVLYIPGGWEWDFWTINSISVKTNKKNLIYPPGASGFRGSDIGETPGYFYH